MDPADAVACRRLQTRQDNVQGAPSRRDCVSRHASTERETIGFVLPGFQRGREDVFDVFRRRFCLPPSRTVSCPAARRFCLPRAVDALVLSAM